MDRPGSAEDGAKSMTERIRERREQLDKRLAEKKAGNSTGGTGLSHSVEDDKLRGKGEAQVRASRAELNKLRASAAEKVTRFRVRCETKENDRRVKAESESATRLQKKQDEAASSAKRNASVELKWESLFFKKIPQELLKDINLQKEACAKIMQAKDRLIEDFRAQLKDADEDYVFALKEQAEDIDNLIETMHEQTDTVIKAYEQELDNIEEAFTQERKQLLESNVAEIDALMLQRESRERDNSKKREQKVIQDQKELDESHEKDAETFAQKKVDLQKEIHALAQQLEAMRAVYLLNQEKLLYNLRVLGQRTDENKRAISAHRLKMQRLQDALSSLLMRHHETDKKYRTTNKELTESYRRITEQYKDLQMKYQHFEKADFDNYNQVWKMNEQECMALVQKCLQADMIVFQELLGVPWQPPKLDFWEAQDPLHQAGDDSAAEAEEDAAPEEDSELSDIAKSMLSMLSAQLPFLIEERVRRVIEGLESEEDRTPKKIEAILRALGAENTQEIQTMLTYFVIERDGGAALIDPGEAVIALHKYLEDRHRRHAQSTAKSQVTVTKEKTRTQRRKAEKAFWERLTNVIPLKHQRCWKSMEAGLEKYLRMLQQRGVLIDETDQLRQQNDELRALLNQYLSTKINQELFAPPQLQVMGVSGPSPGGDSNSPPALM